MSYFHCPRELLHTISSLFKQPVHSHTLAQSGRLCFDFAPWENGCHQKRHLLFSHHQIYLTLHLQPGSVFTSAQWWAVPALFDSPRAPALNSVGSCLGLPLSLTHTRTLLWQLTILPSLTSSFPLISSGSFQEACKRCNLSQCLESLHLIPEASLSVSAFSSPL